MDFQHIDIRRFLVESIPSRFNLLTPSAFESLMAFLFSSDGYEVETIHKTGSADANLISRKDDLSLVIKALRLPPDQMVEIGEIQQAAAARTYYETDQSWVITTSDFTSSARKEADKHDIELWNWDALYQALILLFFEGKSHEEFIGTLQPEMGVAVVNPELKLKAKWKPEEGISSEWYNLDLTISNPTDRNLFIHLDLPALIDGKKNQITAEKWADNEFIAGIIYAGANVRTNAFFNAARLGERPPGGKVMLTCHERTDPPSTYHLSAKLKGEVCYFVTYCYTRQSPQYDLMIRYRDEIIAKYFFGRILIWCYYRVSPFLVEFARKNKLADYLVTCFTKNVILTVLKRKLR